MIFSIAPKISYVFSFISFTRVPADVLKNLRPGISCGSAPRSVTVNSWYTFIVNTFPDSVDALKLSINFFFFLFDENDP